MACGIILVDKPQDWTSFDVVNKLKRIYGERRVGHSGTLDPMATGLLVVFVGRATRAVPFAENARKTYIAGLRAGKATDTQDITGETISSRPLNCSDEEFNAALKAFEGKISQIPPMYSAIKQDGKKLYELARKGKTVERKPREIEIFSIKKLGVRDGDALLEVCCSKGTYIRTLCADIGKRLGGDACMSYLRRTAAGAYDISQAHSIEEIISASEENRQEELLLPLDSMFPTAERIDVSGRSEKKVRNGNSLFIKDIPDGEYRIYGEDGEFLALGESRNCEIRIIKSFFEV